MANIYDMTDTWNNGATTFTAIKMDVSDAASASGSKLMDLQVDGSSKVVINKSGSVGIGASSPDVNFSVFGSASVAADVGGEISIGGFYDGSNKISYASIAGVNQNGTGNTSGQLLFKTRTNFGSLTERLRIDSSGNVGIGTTSAVDSSKVQISGAKTISSGIPQQQLNIADTSAIATGVGGGVSFSALYSGSSFTTMGSIEGNRENGTSGNYAGALVFKTRTNLSSNDERMRIDSSGNVGIGVSSPAAKLHSEAFGAGAVNAAVFSNSEGLANSEARIFLYSGGNSTRGGYLGLINESASGQPSSLTFATSAEYAAPAERMRLNSAGTLITNHNIREKVYNLTGTDINPVNGAIQYKTLGASTTFTESLSDGDSVILRLSGGDTYTVTYPTMTWVTSAGNTAPTLGGSDVIVIWQESSVLYGAYVGSYA